ncbi:MAG: diguanylate cyclase [Proteobacteria bacterium]|nr:diguanylate cyclase [Pseudomonadota bacterium]MBU0965320.1 diguanylate cyclase [Pseudomonadota bacterium]
MNTVQLLSVIMVFVGAGFLLASIYFSLHLLRDVPAAFLTKWRVLFGLMLFFLGGYLLFIVGQLRQIDLSAELVTGVVFFGGALFVFLIINLTENTIAAIREGERLLRSAHDQLEVRVAERTEQLQQALGDLKNEMGEHRKASVSLENTNAELLQVLNCAAEGIRVVDRNFIIQRANRTFAQMAGVSEEKLIGMPCHVAFENAVCHTPDCSLQKILHGAKYVESEKALKRKDGKVLPCIVAAFPYYDREGELIGIVESFRDISQRKEMENILKEMSVTDELTGLLNRRGFLAVADKHLLLVDRVEESLYLLYADLDNMKGINDSLGHDSGDQALVEAADVLKRTFRKSDVLGIGRLGGDEFAVLMFSSFEPCCDHPVLHRLEQQIAERNQQPDRRYGLSMSVGIVRYDPENPCSVEQFLALADKAMYQSKKEKKNVAFDSENVAQLTP